MDISQPLQNYKRFIIDNPACVRANVDFLPAVAHQRAVRQVAKAARAFLGMSRSAAGGQSWHGDAVRGAFTRVNATSSAAAENARDLCRT